MEQIEDMVSVATVQNWNRLKVVPSEYRLAKRANKTMSKKQCIPVAYIGTEIPLDSVRTIVKEILQKEYDIKKAMAALCINQLLLGGLLYWKGEGILSQNPFVEKFLAELSCPIEEFPQELIHCDLGIGRGVDGIGAVYQGLQTEGMKNKKGIYYTPKNILMSMISGIDFQPKDKILDPCCGTGAFLLNIDVDNPKQLFGFDIDEIAVMIAKTNLFLKFSHLCFEPQIQCLDFLLTDFSKKFDYIITNPPWGTKGTADYKEVWQENPTREKFALFLYHATKQLENGGHFVFLFPESILKIKTHGKIREQLLTTFRLEKICIYEEKFSGVMTNVVSITGQKGIDGNEEHSVLIQQDGESFFLPQGQIGNGKDCFFQLLKPVDKGILEKIYAVEHNTLEDSLWGLGIVTGNNKEKLSFEKKDGWELIYTGKEVSPYVLKAPKKYVLFRRSEFQQVAKDEIYRAKEKLIYRFISNKLVFAYDCQGSLCLNSANILIPRIEGYSAKTVLAFLNAEVMQYIYQVCFTDIKVLRGNLEKLPFPQISKQVDQKISHMVSEILEGNIEKNNQLQEVIYSLFGCEKEEVYQIQEKLYGKTNGGIKEKDNIFKGEISLG